MASDELAKAVEPRKKGNVKYASICAILASMASVILGYGSHSSVAVKTFCLLLCKSNW
jgi:hypothetical protein